jgi:hypothetical protein
MMPILNAALERGAVPSAQQLLATAGSPARFSGFDASSAIGTP